MTATKARTTRTTKAGRNIPAREETTDPVEALLDYLNDFQMRVREAGEKATSAVDISDLNQRLSDANPAAAKIVIPVAEEILTQFANRARTTQANFGDLRHVALVLAGRVTDIVAAVAGHQATRDTVDAATAEVERLENAHAEALTRLEKAVDVGDIGEVMRLRPEVEVQIPTDLDAARLALLDAQVNQQKPAMAAVTAIEGAAQERLAVAEAQVTEARIQLEAATASRDLAGLTAVHITQAGRQIRAHVEQITSRRNELATALERDRQRRFRRLAGLPELPNPTVNQGPVAGAHGPNGDRPVQHTMVSGSITATESSPPDVVPNKLEVERDAWGYR